MPARALSEIISAGFHGVLVWLISATERCRLRYRHSPEVVADIDESLSAGPTLTGGPPARLHLIAANDPRPFARHLLPVYYLSGGSIPLCRGIRASWLRKHCPRWRMQNHSDGRPQHFAPRRQSPSRSWPGCNGEEFAVAAA